MKNQPKVSIIIPVKRINDYVHESMGHILALDYPSFEVLIFPDEKDKVHTWPKTRIIPSGKVGPAEKRDLALKYASGKILAFLDDDAYPRADWLKKMVPLFRDGKVAGVGGPAITPASDGILQKVSGAIFESFIGGNFTRNRYLPIGKIAETLDWPTVNLLVWKESFKEVGGFNCAYWPGEDTKLCLDFLNAGYKLLYNPKGIVYHHRRSDLFKHFRQIGNYALHRGHFAKIYPETSRKFGYFVPTLFDIYLLSFFIWPLLSKQYPLGMFYGLPLAIYFLGLVIDAVVISLRWKNPLVGLITIPMIFLTHVWYGIRFVQGLIVRKLER
ncbi:MAG: glycosyltransferase [Candidatus Berkelbacteria bacterium]|nr:glycosyltransferase [Candidatus Berkelbacteria bacterium]